MLSKEHFKEFIDEVNTTYYNFRIWIHSNNEWVKVQDNVNDGRIVRLMIVILHALKQVWILGVARLLDEAYLGNKSRLSVKFILKEAGYPDLECAYNARMKKPDMQKFETSNRQLRNEKISHKTPGSTIRTQEAGAEKFFKIVEYIISELKSNTSFETSKFVDYGRSDSEAKDQVVTFMKIFNSSSNTG